MARVAHSGALDPERAQPVAFFAPQRDELLEEAHVGNRVLRDVLHAVVRSTAHQLVELDALGDLVERTRNALFFLGLHSTRCLTIIGRRLVVNEGGGGAGGRGGERGHLLLKK